MEKELSYQEQFLKERSSYALTVFILLLFTVLGIIFFPLAIIFKQYLWVNIPAGIVGTISVLVVCVCLIKLMFGEKEFPKVSEKYALQEYTKEDTEEKIQILSRIEEALSITDRKAQITAICEATLGYKLSEPELLSKRDIAIENMFFLRKQEDSFWKYFGSWLKENNKRTKPKTK